MSISGIVVKTTPEHIVPVIEALKSSGLCDIHFHDENGTIIVTVEGGDTGEEVKKMREIMNISHVSGANLAYSCIEDETGDNLSDLEHIGDAVPEVLKSLPSDA